MQTFTIESQFSASHAVIMPAIGQEPVHNHQWKILAQIRVKEYKDGDIKDAREALETVLAVHNDVLLNDIDELKPFGASAESLARYLFFLVRGQLSSLDLEIKMIQVEEEPGCWARYWQ